MANGHVGVPVCSIKRVSYVDHMRIRRGEHQVIAAAAKLWQSRSGLLYLIEHATFRLAQRLISRQNHWFPEGNVSKAKLS